MKKLLCSIALFYCIQTHCMLDTRIITAIKTGKVEEGKNFLFQLSELIECCGNNTETIRQEINKPDDYGRTRLLYAIRAKCITVVRLLLQLGADINKRLACFCKTHLLAACFDGDARAINLLLACGAKTEVRDGFGNFPLHTYILYHHSDLVAIPSLLVHGADSRLLNTDGKKAEDFLNTGTKYHTMLVKAGHIRNLIDQHKFEEASEYLFEKEHGEHELFYNALFGLYSKESYDAFETAIKKRLRQFASYRDVTNLQEWLERTVPPQLREHFLKWGIWQLHDRMYNHCTTLNIEQKKDLMIYRYNDLSISKVENDLNFIYL